MRPIRIGLACAAALLATWAGAAEVKFVGGLSTAERTASGISKLTAPQAAALDRLIARDAALAREGGVTGFSSAFSARHTEAERKAAGLDRLSDGERQALDNLAARTIALGPPPGQPFEFVPPAPAAPVPEVTETETTPKKLEVHGDISFTVGGGTHGSSFYGTSTDLFVTDPNHNFTVGVGFDEYRGKGLLGICDPNGPLGPYGPLNEGPPYLSRW